MGKGIFVWVSFLSIFLLGCLGLAQEVVPQDLPVDTFLSQVLQTIKDFGGLSTVAKIAAVTALIVATMKVTFIRQLFWSKLSASKPWVAPLIGLLAGLVDIAGAGTVTIASVFAYIASGAGAIIFHELLDSIKKIPGLGEKYIQLIDFIKKYGMAKPDEKKLP